MRNIQYIPFSQIDPDDFLAILNDDAVRRHLLSYAIFDTLSIRAWTRDKIQVDALPGCRVRAVRIDDLLAGWCGIQPDDSGVELALVLSQRCWGAGKSIFNTLMHWAKELGHQEIRFHLLETRPEYRFLKRKAREIRQTQLSGRHFTTYVLSVADPSEYD